MRYVLAMLVVLGLAMPGWAIPTVYLSDDESNGYADGNDANTGESKALPMATFKQAWAAVDTGGTIICNTGTYDDDLAALWGITISNNDGDKNVTIKRDPTLTGAVIFHNTRAAGGGLFTTAAGVTDEMTVTFENITFRCFIGNADGRGNFYLAGTNTNLVMTGCTITDSTANVSAIAINIEGTASSNSSVTLTNCTITSGLEAVYAEEGGVITLTNCTMSHPASPAAAQEVFEVKSTATIASLTIDGGSYTQNGNAYCVYSGGTVTGLIEIKGGAAITTQATNTAKALYIQGAAGAVHLDDITVTGIHEGALIGSGASAAPLVESTLIENCTFDVSTAGTSAEDLGGQEGLGIQVHNAIIRNNTFLHGGWGEECLGVYRGFRNGHVYGNTFVCTGVNNGKGISMGGSDWHIHHNTFSGVIGIGMVGKRHKVHNNTFYVKSFAGAVGENKGSAIYTTDVTQAGSGTATGAYDEASDSTTITATASSFLPDYMGETFQTVTDDYAASYTITGYISTTKVIVAGDASAAAGAHRTIHTPKDNVITDNIFYADGTTLGGSNTMTCVYIYNNASNRNFFDNNRYAAPGAATLMYFAADQDSLAAVQTKWQTAGANTVSAFNELEGGSQPGVPSLVPRNDPGARSTKGAVIIRRGG